MLNFKCRFNSLFIYFFSYDKAIEFFTKAIKPKSPELLVDTIQLPRSKEEERKLERLGKVQKQRYLENRDITRSQLIETEQLKQETRIQESHCNLLRIYLILANQMKPQIDAIHEDEMHETNTKLNLVSHTSRSKGSSSYAPSKKSTSIGVKAGAGHNASSSLLNANMSVSTSEKKVQSLKLQYSQYLASAHYHLRCAFKSINPVHQSSVRYHTILLMANEQILMLLVRYYQFILFSNLPGFGFLYSFVLRLLSVTFLYLYTFPVF